MEGFVNKESGKYVLSVRLDEDYDDDVNYDELR